MDYAYITIKETKMKFSSIRRTKVTITLEEEEATWLMNALRNPIGYKSTNEEPEEEGNIRRALFEGLFEELE